MSLDPRLRHSETLAETPVAGAYKMPPAQRNARAGRRTAAHAVRISRASVLGDATQALRDQITRRLAALDVREDHSLDLVGNPDWPTDKLSAKMREVHAEREQLRARLTETESPDVTGGAAAIEQILDLLTDPHTMYVRAGTSAKRVLNQAFFTRIYPNDHHPTSTGDTLTAPIEPFVAVNRRRHLSVAPTDPGNDNGGAIADDDAAVLKSPTTLLATALTTATALAGRRRPTSRSRDTVITLCVR